MLDEALKSERNKYQAAVHNYEKLNHLNNCIELENNSNSENYATVIYGDIREFIYYYVIASEEKAYGYYEVNKEKILNKINLVGLKEQINLLNYFQRILKQNGIERNYNWVIKEIKQRKIKDYWLNISFSNFFRLLGHVSTYNIFSLLASIVLLYLIYSTFLLPAPNNNMILFKVQFGNYSTNSLSNHFLNTSLAFCGIESDFKLIPVNWAGVMIEILMKTTLLILILGYLTEELKKRLL